MLLLQCTNMHGYVTVYIGTSWSYLRMFGSGMAEVCLVVECFFPTQPSHSQWAITHPGLKFGYVLYLSLVAWCWEGQPEEGKGEGEEGRAWESSIYLRYCTHASI